MTTTTSRLTASRRHQRRRRGRDLHRRPDQAPAGRRAGLSPRTMTASARPPSWSCAALAIAGLTGMYLRQRRRLGKLGLVGYLVFTVGYLAHVRRRSASSRSSCRASRTSNPGYVKDVLDAPRPA